MFDIGFSELLVIGVVALIVLGPERLPKVARTAGHLFGRLQRYVADVKAEVKREMHNEEIMTSIQEAKDAVAGMERSIREEATQAEHLVKSVPDQVTSSLEFVEEPKAVEVTRAAPQPGAASEAVQEVTPEPVAEPTPQLELPLAPLDKPPPLHSAERSGEHPGERPSK